MEIYGFVPTGYSAKYVTRKGEVFCYYYSTSSSALIIAAVRKLSTRAALSQYGRILAKPTVRANEKFAVFELLSPDGRYRKKYCVCKYDADAATVTLETYAYPAEAFVNGGTSFYDYAGAGFTPVDPQPTKADVLAAVTSLSGAGKGVRGENGRIQLGAGKDTAEDITSTAEYFIKNAVADILEADFGMSCVIGAKSNVDSVGILGKDALTQGSRWMVFVNDWLVDMPGFLENVWPRQQHDDHTVLHLRGRPRRGLSLRERINERREQRMENNILVNVKAWITAALAVLTAFWGWFGWLVVAWVFLMLADWLVGSAAAAKRGEWSSAKLREGSVAQGRDDRHRHCGGCSRLGDWHDPRQRDRHCAAV